MWLYVVIIVLLIFICVGILFYNNYQTSIKKEIHRSDAERSLLQGEIALMNEGRRIDFRDIQWEIKIKTGGQGEVWRGVWLMLPNRYVAIKKMKNFDVGGGSGSGSGNHQTPLSSWETEGGEGEASNLFAGIEGESKNIEEFRQELKLLMRLKPHERTVLFHGAGRVPGTGELFFVSEFMECGDLAEALKKRDASDNPMLSWETRSQIAADIAEGMAFLHSRKPPLIHRDLKSHNVLLRSDGRAKIADFGLSKFADLQQHAAARRSFVSEDESDSSILDPLDEMTGQCGTIPWMAPEVDTGKHEEYEIAKYGLKIDVYSFAIVLFELITCIPPWKREFGNFMAPIQKAVKEGRRPKLTQDEKEEAESNGAKILVLWMIKCWAQQPMERPNFKKILRALRHIECVSKMYEDDSVGEGRRRGGGITRFSSSSLTGFAGSINGGGRYLPPAFNNEDDDSSSSSERKRRNTDSREMELSLASSSGGGGGGGERKRAISFDMDIHGMSSGGVSFDQDSV